MDLSSWVLLVLKANVAKDCISCPDFVWKRFLSRMLLHANVITFELYNWFHIITERRARGDLNLDDAYDELFRLLECLLHPIRSLEQL